MMKRCLLMCVMTLSAMTALSLAGCGSAALLVAYTGGGLPPGDPDIGGIVVTQVSDAGVAALAADTGPLGPPAGTVAVVGAQVQLVRGGRVVGETATGQGGYFRFENPDTGNYSVIVTPPAGTGLQQARHQFRHQRGRQTFLTIELQPEAAPGGANRPSA